MQDCTPYMKGPCFYHMTGVLYMIEETYNYRTSPFLLRNQFSGPGKWKLPLIPKASFAPEEFINLRLIGFDRTNLENENHLDRMVHFFLYD